MRGYPGRSNTLDEDFRADMDNAVSIERRLAAMKAFHDAGVRTTCFISPIFPGLTDLPSIIHRAKNQCNLVWLENLNLRGGYKKTIFDYITEKHPDLLPLYDTIYNKKNAATGQCWMRRCGSFAKRKGYCMSGMMIPSNARSTIRLSWSIIFPTKRLSLGQNAEEQVIKTI